MSVNDAEPGDIYADDTGKLWRVVGVCREPEVTVEEVEGTLHDPNAPKPPYAAQGMGMAGIQGIAPKAEIVKVRRSGGITGYMWNGWQRVWRPKPQQTAASAAQSASAS